MEALMIVGFLLAIGLGFVVVVAVKVLFFGFIGMCLRDLLTDSVEEGTRRAQPARDSEK